MIPIFRKGDFLSPFLKNIFFDTQNKVVQFLKDNTNKDPLMCQLANYMCDDDFLMLIIRASCELYGIDFIQALPVVLSLDMLNHKNKEEGMVGLAFYLLLHYINFDNEINLRLFKEVSKSVLSNNHVEQSVCLNTPQEVLEHFRSKSELSIKLPMRVGAILSRTTDMGTVDKLSENLAVLYQIIQEFLSSDSSEPIVKTDDVNNNIKILGSENALRALEKLHKENQEITRNIFGDNGILLQEITTCICFQGF